MFYFFVPNMHNEMKKDQSEKRNWIKPVQELSTQIVATTKMKSKLKDGL